MRRFLSLGVAIGCVLGHAALHSDLRAQSMRDPMQPPGGGPGAPRAAAPSHSGLQVVITSPTRNLAVIDNHVVPLGGSIRNGTLGSVSDSVAVVRKNGDREVLLMHPNVDKTPARRERP